MKLEDGILKAMGMVTVDLAVRWSKNMLVEVIGNHAKDITPEKRSCIKEAVSKLVEYETLPNE